jgi:hypothetical protein
MICYRIYTVGKDGHFTGPNADEERYDMEIWDHSDCADTLCR